MDRDGSGAIDFEEFGELMLRPQRLMSRYTEFFTYFLPIDVDADDIISMQEMNDEHGTAQFERATSI